MFADRAGSYVASSFEGPGFICPFFCFLDPLRGIMQTLSTWKFMGKQLEIIQDLYWFRWCAVLMSNKRVMVVRAVMHHASHMIYRYINDYFYIHIYVFSVHQLGDEREMILFDLRFWYLSGGSKPYRSYIYVCITHADAYLCGGFKYFAKISPLLHPEPWGFMIQIDDHTFQICWKPPTRISILSVV